MRMMENNNDQSVSAPLDLVALRAAALQSKKRKAEEALARERLTSSLPLSSNGIEEIDITEEDEEGIDGQEIEEGEIGEVEHYSHKRSRGNGVGEDELEEYEDDDVIIISPNKHDDSFYNHLDEYRSSPALPEYPSKLSLRFQRSSAEVHGVHIAFFFGCSLPYFFSCSFDSLMISFSPLDQSRGHSDHRRDF